MLGGESGDLPVGVVRPPGSANICQPISVRKMRVLPDEEAGSARLNRMVRAILCARYQQASKVMLVMHVYNAGCYHFGHEDDPLGPKRLFCAIQEVIL